MHKNFYGLIGKKSSWNRKLTSNSEGNEIYRIMIDREYQGKGYGKEALKLILEYIKTFPLGKAESVYAEWHPDNIASKRLFEEYDFCVVGTDEDGAVVARMENIR